MGYSIYIGEAKAGIDFYEDEVYVYPDVDTVKLDYAPSFPNDELTGNSNYRAPSYSAWSDFLRGAGLYDMFFDKSEGLMREHPGCFIINENHLKKIQGAVKRRKEVSAKQPGFSGFSFSTGCFDEDLYDSTLARLLWLEFWFQWALLNCKNPCIKNS